MAQFNFSRRLFDYYDGHITWGKTGSLFKGFDFFRHDGLLCSNYANMLWETPYSSRTPFYMECTSPCSFIAYFLNKTTIARSTSKKIFIFDLCFNFAQKKYYYNMYSLGDGLWNDAQMSRNYWVQGFYRRIWDFRSGTMREIPDDIYLDTFSFSKYNGFNRQNDLVFSDKDIYNISDLSLLFSDALFPDDYKEFPTPYYSGFKIKSTDEYAFIFPDGSLVATGEKSIMYPGFVTTAESFFSNGNGVVFKLDHIAKKWTEQTEQITHHELNGIAGVSPDGSVVREYCGTYLLQHWQPEQYEWIPENITIEYDENS